MLQRKLVRALQIERATLSVVVSALVKKGLVEQRQESDDLRQKTLVLTSQGERLWKSLPDPTSTILNVAFKRMDATEMEVARRVLKTATARIQEHLSQGLTPCQS